MRLPFYKYQATGNDFVIINQMMIPYLENPSQELVSRLCDRRFGIGADGLMLIAPSDRTEFKMIYYNSDGRLSTMCGNGGRAIVHLAHRLKLIKTEVVFEAADGMHDAHILDADLIALKMIDVDQVNLDNSAFVIHTGSPHYVDFAEDVHSVDLIPIARDIRYSKRYGPDGINVNFMEYDGEALNVRTYERGVEDETYSCGTGVTAAAIAYAHNSSNSAGEFSVNIITKGGPLNVKFTKTAIGYSDVWLTGPAQKVYEGVIDL